MSNERKKDGAAPLLPPPAPAGGALAALASLVETLRGPQGCPWDREQAAADLRPYLLEEAHEVADALDRSDWPDLQGELGDLLFQIVFLSSLAHERGAFSLGDVIDGVHRKMVERHPHVFDLGEAERLTSAGDVRQAWERRKAVAKARAQDEGRGGDDASLLDGVAASLPALVASYRLSEKAGGVGFDWPDATSVLDKVDEELAELRERIPAADDRRRADREAAAEELGDLLFTLANLARKLRVDPEASLARANLKFRRRFASVEKALRQRGVEPGQASLSEMETLWSAAKAAEPRRGATTGEEREK